MLRVIVMDSFYGKPTPGNIAGIVCGICSWSRIVLG